MKRGRYTTPNLAKDAQLWVWAVFATVMLLVVFLGMIGVGAVLLKKGVILPLEEAGKLKEEQNVEDSTVMVFPEMVEKVEERKVEELTAERLRMEQERELARVKKVKPSFVRTSEEQAPAVENKKSAWIGERATQAASDHEPVTDGLELPAQRGRLSDDFETTESRYQDGELAKQGDEQGGQVKSVEVGDGGQDQVTQEASRGVESQAGAMAAAEELEREAKEKAEKAAKEKEVLMQGTSSVELPVAKGGEKPATREDKTKVEESPKLPEDLGKGVGEMPAEQGVAKPEVKKEQESVKEDKKKSGEDKIAEEAGKKNGFKGNQHKAIILGSIKRTGVSSLDVEDSPLGKYCAVISRAVELEFQRNCVRHRDYITPGFLTVRFFVETNGKVKSCVLDGDMATGEIQKGFTLNSIRNAAIPPMPNGLKKEYTDKPLELVFRFYF